MNQRGEIYVDIRKFKPFILGGIAIVILLILLSSAVKILQPTERGVIFKKYTTGLDVEDVKGEGLNIIAPWNDIIIFDVAEQQIEESMDVLSQDGLSINIDVSLRFRPKPSEIGYLYQSFRRQYIMNLVRPELRSAVRRIVGQYTPEELYSTKRQEIELKIEEATGQVLDKNHVELKALLFRSIKLPLASQKSI